MTQPAEYHASRPVLSSKWYIGPSWGPSSAGSRPNHTNLSRDHGTNFRNRRSYADKENHRPLKRKEKTETLSLNSNQKRIRRSTANGLPANYTSKHGELGKPSTVSSPHPNSSSSYPLRTRNWWTETPVSNNATLQQLSVSKLSPGRLAINIPYDGGSKYSGYGGLPVLKTTETLSSILSRNGITATESQLGPSDTVTDSSIDPSESILVDDIAKDFLLSDNPSLCTINGIGQSLDDAFILQTPTKTLSESDQLSFHLASPPAILRNLVGGFSGSRSTDRYDSDRFSSDLVEFRSVCTRLFDYPEDNLESRKPIVSRSPFAASSLVSSTSRLSRPSIQSSKDENCIAVLTAKATVWNRPLEPSSATQNPESLNCKTIPAAKDDLIQLQKMSGADYLPALLDHLSVPKLPPLPLLNVPPRQQPHLSIRRVLQVASEQKWRKFALGISKTHRTNIRLAQHFLNGCSHVPCKSEEPLSSSFPECNSLVIKTDPN